VSNKKTEIVTAASRGMGAAIAPRVVDTPPHENDSKEDLKALSPMGTIAEGREIADAVVSLTEARSVAGEVLHLDGGAHAGKW
jgi:NAD(P)-dependent dehydrogenase (short-subunit alcohol dehydrogenase family)